MSDSPEEALAKARPFFESEAKELTEVLGQDDAVANRLLRFHLLTEYMLDRIITTRLKRGDRVLEDGNLSYHQKLLLVHSLDILPDKAIASLRQLNKLRNALSHERSARVTISDLESIGRPYGKDFAGIRAKHKDDLKTLTFAVFLLPWVDLEWELAPQDVKGGTRESS
jgi:hypothetical protein